MNVLITAGGTSEKIDNVRKITNNATGRLGSLIAKAFYDGGGVDQIYYVCGADSIVPALPNTKVIRITGVDELIKTLESILKSEKIDAVIHSMAVSDYSVSSAASAESLAENISKRLMKETAGQFGCKDAMALSAMIQAEMDSSGRSLSKTGKISSDIDHLVLLLEKTPKVIGMFKRLQPQTVLVGFKLLDGVCEEELVDTAYRLLQKNNCDFVLANDSQSFLDGGHRGILLSPDRQITNFNGKEAIAQGIARAVKDKLGSV